MADTSTKLDLFENGNSLELFTLDDTPDSLGGALGNHAFSYAVVYEATTFNKGIRVTGATKTTALSTNFYWSNVTDKTISVKFELDAVPVNATECLISDASRFFANSVTLAYVATATDMLTVQFGNGLGGTFNMTDVDISTFRGDGLLHTLTMSNEGDECYLWIDGALQQQATSTTSLTNVSSATGNGQGLMFGLISTESSGADETWNGVLDQPRILTEAITTSDKAQVIHFEDDSYWTAPAEIPVFPVADFNASDDIEGYVQVTFTKADGLPVPTHDLYKGGVKIKDDVETLYSYPATAGTDSYFVRASNTSGDTDSNTDNGTSLDEIVPLPNPIGFLGEDTNPVHYAFIGEEPVTRIYQGDTPVYYWKTINDRVYPSGFTTKRIQDYADRDAMTIVDYATSEFSKLVPVDGSLNRAIFSSYTDNSTSTYNQTAIDVDLSGVNHSTEHSGTLVTSQHMIVANHYKSPIGATIYFHDLAGTSYAREVVSELCFSDVTNFEHSSDACVQKLDSPLPAGIKVYPVFDRNGYTDINVVGVKTITLDKNRNMNVAEVLGVGTDAGEYVYFSSGPTSDYVYDTPVFNDSGSPTFVIVDGEMCVCSTLTASYITASDFGGANYGDQLYLLTLDEIINSLGSD